MPSLWLHDVAVRFASNTVTFESQYCNMHCNDAPVTVQGVTDRPPLPVFPWGEGIFGPQIRPQRSFWGNILVLNRSLFFRVFKKGNVTGFKASLSDINKSIEAKDLTEWFMEEIVPKQYHEFLPLLNKVFADWLPPYRPGIDHEVCLKEGETPTWGPLYSITRAELVMLKERLENNMSKRFIHQSSSRFEAPAMSATKHDAGLRLGIN